MKKKTGKEKLVLALCLATSVGMVLTACSNSKDALSTVAADVASGATYDMLEYDDAKANQEYQETADVAYEFGEYAEGVEQPAEAMNTTSTGSETNIQTPTSQKLIKTINMEMETENFEAMMAGLEQKINSLGGYVETQYTYNGSAYNNTMEKRYASVSARIPEDKLDDFIKNVSADCNVVSKNTSTENVTLAYVDIESRKKMLLAEQESYLALLEKAATVEDITYLTTELTEVRYQIECMESQLRTYDNLVDYATVNLQINEVEIYTPTTIEVEEEKTTGQIIAEGFMKNLKEIGNSFTRFGINFVIALPNIVMFLIWCAVVFFAIRLIIFIIKKMVKKSIAKRAAKKELALEAKENAEQDKKEEQEEKNE